MRIRIRAEGERKRVNGEIAAQQIVLARCAHHRRNVQRALGRDHAVGAEAAAQRERLVVERLCERLQSCFVIALKDDIHFAGLQPKQRVADEASDDIALKPKRGQARCYGAVTQCAAKVVVIKHAQILAQGVRVERRRWKVEGFQS